MASITKNNGEQSMAEESDQHEEPEREEREERPQTGGPVSAPAAAHGPGFFHIYKPGQGYWTRMGTVAGSALVILLVGNFFYTYMPTWIPPLATRKGVLVGIVLGIMAALSVAVFAIINKPGNADFLIATDSEMKKVNWTSRRELIGSTKVVVIFLLIVMVLLFGIDIFFGYLFYFLRVLKQPPI
jgi:preprotein translocase subunit SecE